MSLFKLRRRARNCRTVARSFSPSLEMLEDRQLLSFFTVVNNSDSGPGSLRQAILDSNAQPGLDTIAFHIDGGGVQTIQLTSVLPAITDPIVMDGSTQPGFAGSPLIELSGRAAGPEGNGLFITAGNSVIRALAINGFSGSI